MSVGRGTWEYPPFQPVPQTLCREARAQMFFAVVMWIVWVAVGGAAAAVCTIVGSQIFAQVQAQVSLHWNDPLVLTGGAALIVALGAVWRMGVCSGNYKAGRDVLDRYNQPLWPSTALSAVILTSVVTVLVKTGAEHWDSIATWWSFHFGQ